jgi:acylphosphatase
MMVLIPKRRVFMREVWIAKGKVQGVGFRWYVSMIARRFHVPAGYVKNLEDGSVEIVLETTFPQKDSFLHFVKQGDGSGEMQIESLTKQEEDSATCSDHPLTFEIR